MTYQDWTIRNKDGVAIIRVEGKDYTEIPDTTQVYPAAYPDTVRNTVLERSDDGKVRIVLGQVRYVFNESNELEEVKSVPQTVWLQEISEETALEAAPEETNNDDGFITG